MMHRTTYLLLLALAAASTSPALAQKVYRCGNTYSQQPCFDAKPVPTDDARTESQRVQAREAAQRDARLANDMEKARLKQEAQAARQDQASQPGKPGGARPEAKPEEPRTSANDKKLRKPAVFTAVAPAKPGSSAGHKKKSD